MKNDDKVRFGEFSTIFQGKIFTIKQRPIIYPDGRKEIFEYCQRFNSVTVLAFDERKRLLLTREFREGRNEYVWFLPAGKVDHGETPEQAMQRELREEIGKRADTYRLLFTKPAGSSYFLWDIYVFAAKDLIADPLKPEEFFPIEVVPMPLAQAVDMALADQLGNIFLAYNIIRFDYMLKKGEFSW